MRELDEYINQVKHLPPAPQVLPDLLATLGKEDVDTDRVVKLIAYDPSITASVIQLCNSAFYAPARPIGDLNQAVTWLGFKQIYTLVAAIVGSRTLGPEQKGYGFAKGELWQHSVASAVAAQVLARKLDDDESTVFTAALLHDLGKIVLSEALEKVYQELVQETEVNQRALLECEKALLGVQHAEVGGRLLTRWKFPESIATAVWYHHQPRQAGNHQRLAAYVYLGNLIAHFLGHSYGFQALALRGRAEALEILQLTPESLPHFMIQTVEQLTQVNSLFSNLA